MKKFLKIALLLVCGWGACIPTVWGQKVKPLQMQRRQTVQQDKGETGKKTKEIVSIEKFVKPSAKRYTGMFNVYEQDERFYVEIPDRLMGRVIAAQQVLAKGSAQNERASTQVFGYAGDALASRLIRFVNGGEKEIWLVEPDGGVWMNDTTSEIYRLSQQVGKKPVSMVFDVLAKGKESVLFDITDALITDNVIFSLKDMKQTLGLGGYQADRSSVKGCSVFPDNVIFRMIKCYGAGAPPQLSSFSKKSEKEIAQNPTVWELGVSLVLLPEEPMPVRYEDSRVGYFVEKCTDYDVGPLKTRDVSIAARWRMEPRPEDMEKYKRGELVEPRKPIVFYVDCDVPEFMIPHLIAGVNDWVKVFERAGFKNAIQAKRMPRPGEDPRFSMEDARYSTISYKASPIGNAFGLKTSDPRTGEILCAHISLFHCVQKLVQKWYFAQASVLDERAHRFPFPDELVGRLVRYVVSHEVGHTLGLRHNYFGSNCYTIDQIRDKNYVKEFGHTASIMDYARFNYVAQPGDGIAGEDLMPRVGEYDFFAVEWGYRYFPEMKDAKEVRSYLSAWTTKQREENPRRIFGSEYSPSNPRMQNGDLGDNNMKADELGIQNLKRITKNIEGWTEGDDLFGGTFKDMYMGLCDQYLAYMTHAVRNVGGYFIHDKLRSEGPGFRVPVGREQQKEAMAFLDKHFFHAPDWLFEDRLTNLAKMNKVRVMRMLYGRLLKDMVSRYNNVLDNQLRDEDTYGLQEYADDLYRMVFTEDMHGKPVEACRKELHRMYVKSLRSAMEKDFRDYPVLTSVIFGQLEKLKVDARQAMEKSKDERVKGYWESVGKL